MEEEEDSDSDDAQRPVTPANLPYRYTVHLVHAALLL